MINHVNLHDNHKAYDLFMSTCYIIMLYVVMLHVNLNMVHVITNNLHVNIINPHVDIIYLACRRQKHDSKLNTTVHKTYVPSERIPETCRRWGR